MVKVKTNVCNENGVMRGNVRSALHAEITGVFVQIKGEMIEVTKMKDGEFFAPIAVGSDDRVVNAKVDLSLTVADYQPPKPRVAKPKDKEVIEIETME